MLRLDLVFSKTAHARFDKWPFPPLITAVFKMSCMTMLAHALTSVASPLRTAMEAVLLLKSTRIFSGCID